MGRRFLFLDDDDFFELIGLTKTMHQPVKHPDNPVVERTGEWERVLITLYGSVILDEGLYRMWYFCHCGRLDAQVRIGDRPHGPEVTGYAESDDGVHWRKPTLGLVAFEGSTENNIVPLGIKNVEGPVIIRDVRDPDPKRRYKAFWNDHISGLPGMHSDDGLLLGRDEEDGMFVAFSADGIQWDHFAGNPVLETYSDCSHQMVFDEGLGKYVAYGRMGSGARKVSRTESDDFINWSKPELVLETDDADGYGAQFYSMSVFIYEGMYVGFPWLFPQRFRDTRSHGNDDRIYAQLACSRDGIKWRRLGNRQPFIPNGPPEAFDGGIIYTGTQPVILDDRILIYYGAQMWPHRKPGREDHQPRGIGLATLRRDGFISVDAGDDEGELVTNPFEVTPDMTMHVNVDAPDGQVHAKLADVKSCEPIAEAAPSTTVSGDHLDAELTWPAETLQTLAGKTVRARICLRRAQLYSYWFSP